MKILLLFFCCCCVDQKNLLQNRVLLIKEYENRDRKRRRRRRQHPYHWALPRPLILCCTLLYRIIWHSVLIKTKVVILTSFVAHWRAPEAGRRGKVWRLLGAAKFCRVAKLRLHWRCDLIDKFCQSLPLVKTDLSLVRVGPYSTK